MHCPRPCPERLHLLYDRAAPNAILNAGGRADVVRCFPGTREEVLAKIEAWITTAQRDDVDQRQVFWLSGPAGAGKSAIVQTLAERCIARNLPMANFFFFRGDYTRNNVRAVVATLVCQLLDSFPKLKPLIGAVLEDKPLLFDQSLHDQFKHLIKNPLHAIKEVVGQWPIVILIDGLDECDSAGKHEQGTLLQVLHSLISYENSPFIVLVASRSEPHITMTFNEIGSCAESVFLDENYRPSDDIRLFVVAEFKRIKNAHHLGHILDEIWPSKDSINAIVDKSSGQFVYAATVLRFIANSSASPALSLDKVLGLRPVKKSSPFAQLDAIYTHILSHADDWEAAKDILAAQIFLFVTMPSGPLRAQHIHITIHMILHPMGYSVDDSASHTSDLTAIVRFDHKLDQLQFYHASLVDFLSDATRSGEYYIDIGAFISKLAPAHIKGIRNFESLLTSFFVTAYVDQPTSSIDEALISCPPPFEWHNTEIDVVPFIIRFLRKIQNLYLHRNDQLCQLILRNWLTWFRDMNFVFRDEDLDSAELAHVWQEITAPRDDLVETSLTQLRSKKAPLWKRVLRGP